MTSVVRGTDLLLGGLMVCFRRKMSSWYVNNATRSSMVAGLFVERQTSVQNTCRLYSKSSLCIQSNTVHSPPLLLLN